MTRSVQFSPPTHTRLDNLLSDFVWFLGDESRVITFALASAPSDYFIDPEVGYDAELARWNLPFREAFSELDEHSANLVIEQLASLEAIINVEFVRVENAADAVLRFAVTDLAPEGESYLVFPPSPDLLPFSVDYTELHAAAGIAGDIWLDATVSEANLADALLPAIALALGLSEPAVNGFSVSGDLAVVPLSSAESSVSETVFAQNGAQDDAGAQDGAQNVDGTAESILHTTFMPLDVAALVYLYGPSQLQDNSLYIINESADDFLTAGNLDYGEDFITSTYLNGLLNIADFGGLNALVINVEEDLQVNLNDGATSVLGVGKTLHISAGSTIHELVTVDGNDTITGNKLANTISSRGGNDHVSGGPGNDRVFLDGGDDTYVYTAGGDQVYGGTGTDILVLDDGLISQYKFVQNSDGLTISNVVNQTAAELSGFEQVEILGGLVSVGDVLAAVISENAASGLLLDDGPLYQSAIQSEQGTIDTEQAQLYRIYYGSLGRAPDQAGFDFWMEQLDSETYGLAEIATRFVASAEFVALADSNASGNVGAEEFVTHMYTNVFGRTPDAEGFEWWVDQLFSLEHTQGSAFVSMVQSDEFVLLTAATVADFWMT